MKITRKQLQDHFDRLKKGFPELSNIILTNSDGRLGKLVALIDNEYYLKTDFMTYKEMNQFLVGYCLGRLQGGLNK